MAINGVVCFSQVEIYLIQWDFVDGSEFLLELQFDDGRAGAAMAAKAIRAVVERDFGLHPRVDDGLTYFPGGLEEANAANPPSDLGRRVRKDHAT